MRIQNNIPGMLSHRYGKELNSKTSKTLEKLYSSTAKAAVATPTPTAKPTATPKKTPTPASRHLNPGASWKAFHDLVQVSV